MKRWTSDKINEVLQMRANGMTYKQIGDAFLVTGERIHQIIMKQKREENRKSHELDALPIRVRNALLRKKITTISELKEIVRKSEDGHFYIRNIGELGEKAIYEFLHEHGGVQQ